MFCSFVTWVLSDEDRKKSSRLPWVATCCLSDVSVDSISGSWTGTFNVWLLGTENVRLLNATVSWTEAGSVLLISLPRSFAWLSLQGTESDDPLGQGCWQYARSALIATELCGAKQTVVSDCFWILRLSFALELEHICSGSQQAEEFIWRADDAPQSEASSISPGPCVRRSRFSTVLSMVISGWRSKWTKHKNYASEGTVVNHMMRVYRTAYSCHEFWFNNIDEADHAITSSTEMQIHIRLSADTIRQISHVFFPIFFPSLCSALFVFS